MKFSLVSTLGLALALSCSTSHATLIGDTISINYWYPVFGTGSNFANPVVSAGIGDIAYFGTYFSINPEASSILVDFTKTDTWNPVTFSGLYISGIDDVIVSATYSSNMAGFSASRFSFDAHSVTVNWQGLSFTPDSFFDVFFQLTPSNAIPDGGATAAMLGLAVLGLAAIRRRLA